MLEILVHDFKSSQIASAIVAPLRYINCLQTFISILFIISRITYPLYRSLPKSVEIR